MARLPVTKAFLSGHSQSRIGIIGAGNIGRLITGRVLKAGHPPADTLVSCRGSQASIEALRRAGLPETSIIASGQNQVVLDKCKVVFLTLRPQDAHALHKHTLVPGSVVISLMAGISMKTLHGHFESPDTGESSKNQKSKTTSGNVFVRALTCGHDMIHRGKGIIAFHPAPHPVATELFNEMGFQSMGVLLSEQECHAFSVLVVMPAAMVACNRLCQTVSLDGARRVAAAHGGLPCVEDLYQWSVDVSKDLLWNEGMDVGFEDYMRAMYTKGGITEAVVERVLAGGSFEMALEAGFKRVDEILAKA